MEEQQQLITPPKASQILQFSTTPVDMNCQFEATHPSSLSWLCLSFFELAVALLLWMVELMSFMAAKLFRTLSLPPPYFVPRCTANWLGYRGSVLCDHVSHELCILSESILHGDYEPRQNAVAHCASSFMPATLSGPISNCVKPCCRVTHSNGHPYMRYPVMRTHDDISISKSAYNSHHCRSATSTSHRRKSFSSKRQESAGKHHSTVYKHVDSRAAPDASFDHYNGHSLKVFPEEQMDIAQTPEGSTSGMHKQVVFPSEMEQGARGPIVVETVVDADTTLDSETHDVKISPTEAPPTVESEALDHVYLELEKERAASAIAAAEAMAMIAKVQKDKAGLQMEAVQYQRIVDEKAQCYEEAIGILRELLMRQEEGRACLQREVKQYRRKLLHQEDEAEEESTIRNEFSGQSTGNCALRWINGSEDLVCLTEGQVVSDEDSCQDQQNQFNHVKGSSNSEESVSCNKFQHTKDSDNLQYHQHSQFEIHTLADKHWHDVLCQICTLEKQIHLLRSKQHDLATSSHDMQAYLNH